MRNIKDLLYFILCLVMRRDRWYGHQQRTQDSHEHDDALAQKIAPFSAYLYADKICGLVLCRLTPQKNHLLMPCPFRSYRLHWSQKPAQPTRPA